MKTNPDFWSTTECTKTIGSAALYQVQNQLDLYTCEEIQKYLKEKYGLGTFNLSLPFKFTPLENELQQSR